MSDDQTTGDDPADDDEGGALVVSLGVRREEVASGPDEPDRADDTGDDLDGEESDDSGRERAHPTSVTADRLGQHLDRYSDRLTPRERQALAEVAETLDAVAAGRSPETVAWLSLVESVADGLAEIEPHLDAGDAERLARAREIVEGCRG